MLEEGMRLSKEARGFLEKGGELKGKEKVMAWFYIGREGIFKEFSRVGKGLSEEVRNQLGEARGS